MSPQSSSSAQPHRQSWRPSASARTTRRSGQGWPSSQLALQTPSAPTSAHDAGRARVVVEHLVRVAAGRADVAHRAQRQAAACPARVAAAAGPPAASVRQTKPGGARRARLAGGEAERRAGAAVRRPADERRSPRRPRPVAQRGRLARRRADAARERRRAAASRRAGQVEPSPHWSSTSHGAPAASALDLDDQRRTAGRRCRCRPCRRLSVTSYSPGWRVGVRRRALGAWSASRRRTST